MKPEEVMAMTDEQLRIKAAELMGVEREYLCCEDLFCPPTKCLYGEDDVYDCPHLREGKDVNDCPEMRRGDLPDYPNDIAAAWELIRALPEDMTMTIYPGRMVILEQSEMYELAGGGIAAPLYSEIARFIGDSDERNITKAFIIAMGEKK